MPIFRLVFALPWLLVVTRVLWPLHLPLIAKCAVALLLLVASQYHFFSRLSSGSVLCPEFPRPIVVWFNWALGSIMLLALMQIAFEVGLLVVTVIHGSIAVPDGVRYGMAGLAAVLSAIGVSQAMRVPPLRDITVEIADLPPAFDGYTLLHLTDLHISRLFPAAWARAVVQRSNALKVDLIAITGDLIDGRLSARRNDIAPLGELRAKDGVYVIPGNHEYYFGYPEYMQHYADLGMHRLDNAHTVLERGDAKLVLAGVTDRAAHGGGHPVPDLAAALDGVPRGAPIILLDHQPGAARQAAARGVALQLSGHTHGGLIAGIDRLASRANGGFVSRRYQVGNMVLYVNNGTGLWPGFALRLGRPSELTRITLRRGRSGGAAAGA